MSSRLTPITTLKVKSATQVRAYVPFTALPQKWAGWEVAIVPHYSEGSLSTDLQQKLRDLIGRAEASAGDSPGALIDEYAEAAELVDLFAESVKSAFAELGLNLEGEGQAGAEAKRPDEKQGGERE